MNACPEAVNDGFVGLVDELRKFREWVRTCPLLTEESGAALDLAQRRFHRGMNGISQWSDDHENSGGVSSEYIEEVVRDNFTLLDTDDVESIVRDNFSFVNEDEVQTLIDDADFATESYVVDAIGDIELLDQSDVETFVSQSDLASDVAILEAKEDATENKNETAESLVSLFKQLLSLADQVKPVATDVRYETTTEEVPAVECSETN